MKLLCINGFKDTESNLCFIIKDGEMYTPIAYSRYIFSQPSYLIYICFCGKHHWFSENRFIACQDDNDILLSRDVELAKREIEMTRDQCIEYLKNGM